MPTTVHIPQDLLDAVDERARARGVSRNRFVIQALVLALSEERAWSQEFLEALDNIHPADASVVDDMLEAIVRGRKSKKPVDL